MTPDKRIARLAQQIDKMTREDEHHLLREREIAALRREAACELHSVCVAFVRSVSRLLSRSALELSPPEYGPEMFHDEGINLIQINAHGRIVQIVFQTTRKLFSTEEFGTPYILEGEIRAYNQNLLDLNETRTLSLFFCVEQRGNSWRCCDSRAHRVGGFDLELLLGLMEGLV